ncbi:MAG: ABC transporter ATP-binding protein/permease [Proteobacteria bacterium]|nr:ABC transporter ATP-binding protein/permease [Pseudomonadota bacterium]
MHLLKTFARAYPLQSAVMLFALLIAGLVEGVSLTALLPLLDLVLDKQGTPGGDVSGVEAHSGVGGFVLGAVEAAGFTPSILILLIIILLGAILKGGLSLLARQKVGYIVAHVATDLRLSMLRAMLASRWEYFLHQPVGRLTNSMSIEAVRAANAYLYGATLMSLIIEAAVYLTIASLVKWQAALIALLVGMLIYLLLGRLVKSARRAGKRQTKFTGSMIARLADTLLSVKPLKSMGRERLVNTVLISETRNINRALRREVMSAEVLSAGQEVLFALVLVVGIYITLVKLELPLATVMVLGYLIHRVLKQTGRVQRNYQKMAVCESAYWSIQKTIEQADLAIEPLGGRLNPTLEDAIELTGVSFSYDDKQILNELSLSIPAGSFTAIIGPSGTGKTTILDLIIGLLQPTSGRVLVDGVPLPDLDMLQWRRSIGYVPQETVLLHDSIFNNVSLGDPAISEADVVAALQAAEAWAFTEELPAGIHSDVGERGGKLSGGQRQRIMIARALVHRPRLLIMDEATTALDPQSEAAICETLQKLRGRQTILVISHQSALLAAADRAYRMQDGHALLEKGLSG